MIETDNTGDKQLLALILETDSFDWTDWERSFIESLNGKSYSQLTKKQKSVVTNLYDKLKG